MIRFGIVGTGGFCRGAHFPSLLNRKEAVRVSALYNRGEQNRHAALDLLAEHDVSPRVYSDPAELVVSDEVDAVLLCLPPEFHPDLICTALTAGKHVFCEKPVSNGLDGARRVYAAAEQAKTVFHVGFVLRYSNLFKTIVGIIEEGDIGLPKMVWNRALFTSDWAYRQGSWVNDPGRSGGSLNAWAVHAFDLMAAMAGSYPQSCHGVGGHLVREDTVNTDAVFLNVSYESQVAGSLQMCRFAPRGDDWWIGCIGTHGMIDAGFFQRKIILRTARDTNQRVIEPPAYEQHSFDGMQQQMDCFIEAVRSAGTTFTGAIDGYYATALALCAEQSIRENRSIDIPYL